MICTQSNWNLKQNQLKAYSMFALNIGWIYVLCSMLMQSLYVTDIKALNAKHHIYCICFVYLVAPTKWLIFKKKKHTTTRICSIIKYERVKTSSRFISAWVNATEIFIIKHYSFRHLVIIHVIFRLCHLYLIFSCSLRRTDSLSGGFIKCSFITIIIIIFALNRLHLAFALFCRNFSFVVQFQPQ